MSWKIEGGCGIGSDHCPWRSEDDLCGEREYEFRCDEKDCPIKQGDDETMQLGLPTDDDFAWESDLGGDDE